ncbi:MAG: IS30 family transposase [Clostridiaceae bacterium]|nr:IS30 family transposase [Clostridiaceae bacterium]
MGKFKHLTFNDRLHLEILKRAGHKPKEIAELLNFHVSTIYRELKRGEFEAVNSDLTKEKRYSPDIAQEYMNGVLEAKGAGLKIGTEKKFADRIEEIIINDGYSPAAALAQAKKEGIEFTVCVTTLYSYIDKGIFLNLTLKDLPVKRKGEKRKKRKLTQKRATKGESIEKRPEEIDGRKIFGHWEMDTVVGARGISKKSLLVLTERKTRKEMIFLLKEHTASAVVKALDRLERKIGSAKFRKIFQTITVDNGSEFSDWEGMECSKRNKKKRTKIYYCHPYSSWERGSNENQNKLIRRRIPKGVNFDDKTQRDIDEMTKWINNYPRRLFDYQTAEELFNMELQRIAA